MRYGSFFFLSGTGTERNFLRWKEINTKIKKTKQMTAYMHDSLQKTSKDDSLLSAGAASHCGRHLPVMSGNESKELKRRGTGRWRHRVVLAKRRKYALFRS